jgi:putative endonuclease
MNEGYFVYILASKRNGTLYIGVTNNVVKRVFEHKSGFVEGFTKKHNVKDLVYVENHSTPEEAIHREKCLKRWKRDWKIKLIETQNPLWNDLYPSLSK